MLLAVSAVLAAETRPVKVVLFPFREAEIVSKIDGTVQAYRFRIGEPFKAGDTLISIDDTRYKIEVERGEAKVAEARIQADFADESYRAQLKLFQQDFQSKLEISRRKAEVDGLVARVKIAEADCAEARLLLSYCLIKAPFDGKIEAVLCREYENVRAGQPLLKIIDDNTLLAVMNVPLATMAPVGTEVRFLFQDGTIPASGQVFEISPRADHRSGTIEIKVKIANPEGKLTPGMTGVLVSGKAEAGAADDGE